MSVVDLDGNQGNNHGCCFSDDKTNDSKADGWFHAAGTANIVNCINTADSYDLFGQLTGRRDGCLTDAVEVAVDTGVHGCHGNGQGNDAKQRSSPLFHKEINSNFIRKTVNTAHAQKGKRHGNHKACE